MCSILLLLPLHTRTCVTIIPAKQWLLYIPLCRVLVPQLRQVADRLSRRQTRFNTRSVHLRFCGGRSIFGTASSPSTFALPPNIILPTPHSHSTNHQQCCTPSTNDISIQQHSSALHFNTTVYSHVSYDCHSQQSLCRHETLQCSVLHEHRTRACYAVPNWAFVAT